MVAKKIRKLWLMLDVGPTVTMAQLRATLLKWFKTSGYVMSDAEQDVRGPFDYDEMFGKGRGYNVNLSEAQLDFIHEAVMMQYELQCESRANDPKAPGVASAEQLNELRTLCNLTRKDNNERTPVMNGWTL